MNRDQLTGMLRIAIPVLLTYLASMRLIPDDAVGAYTQVIVDFIAATITLISLFLSWRAWHSTKQIDKVSKLPEVKAVVADAKIADGPLADNPKVITPEVANAA